MSEVYTPTKLSFVILSKVQIDYDVVYDTVVDCIQNRDYDESPNKEVIQRCVHKLYELDGHKPANKYCIDILLFDSVKDMSEQIQVLQDTYGSLYYLYGFVVEA